MLVRHHLEMANVRLETRVPENEAPLACDADQLQQALVALFVNAVEAMGEGGLLTVIVESFDDRVDLAVSDTGPGIPPEVLHDIFEPFFSTKDSGNGVGLGLSVVYGIVQRHHGTIRVDTEVGRGTTFRIRLPRLVADAAEPDPAAAETSSAEKGVRASG
jgi:signal transduction histidine kinase